MDQGIKALSIGFLKINRLYSLVGCANRGRVPLYIGWLKLFSIIFAKGIDGAFTRCYIRTIDTRQRTKGRPMKTSEYKANESLAESKQALDLMAERKPLVFSENTGDNAKGDKNDSSTWKVI